MWLFGEFWGDSTGWLARPGGQDVTACGAAASQKIRTLKLLPSVTVRILTAGKSHADPFMEWPAFLLRVLPTSRSPSRNTVISLASLVTGPSHTVSFYRVPLLVSSVMSSSVLQCWVTTSLLTLFTAWYREHALNSLSYRVLAIWERALPSSTMSR